jgi:TRAP-type C4-dicarboxylate transport system permease small subunit
MRIRTIAKSIILKTAEISDRLSWIASGSLLLITLVVFINIAGRYLFRQPILGTIEIVEILMALVGAFSMFFTATQKGHIIIDTFIEKLPERVKVGIDIAGSLLGAGFWAIVGYEVLLYGLEVFAKSETTPNVEIPVSPFLFALAAGLFLYSIACLFQPLSHLFTKYEIGGTGSL